jgi:hypothetical protein
VFAEGFTGAGFQEYVTLANPGDAEAVATIQFLLGDGTTRTLGVRVAAGTRVTVDVNIDVGAGLESGLSVTSNEPLVAERPQYFRAPVAAAGLVDGGHVALGAAGPSTSWFFAEGYTGDGFQEYITLVNPTDADVAVDIALLRAEAPATHVGVTVPSRARRTLDVNAALGPGVEAAATVTSSGPVVAERSMYFTAACGPGCRAQGGHVVVGAFAPSPSWTFAEGYTGPGFREYLTVANPGRRPADVPVMFTDRSGRSRSITIAVAGGRRATVDVGAVVGADEEVAAIVGPASEPVVVERPQYFSASFPSDPATPVPAPAARDPVIAAAGDIACSPSMPAYNGGAGTADQCQMRATSDLLVAGGFTAVLALGDLQYENGALADFEASYDPTWGRLKDITRPAPGNHEYGTAGAAGYFAYWGAAAGDRERGWYSFDVGTWHLVSLNSNCGAVGGCGAGSAQEQWLRADLRAHPAPCTLAYWHHPRWTSGSNGDSPAVDGLVRALTDAGVDLLITGHDHDYQRFAPQSPDGSPDPVRGIREFVVGTGGRSHYPVTASYPNREVADDTHFGALVLTLGRAGYSWRFAATDDALVDAGDGACH